METMGSGSVSVVVVSLTCPALFFFLAVANALMNCFRRYAYNYMLNSCFYRPPRAN